MKKISLKDVFVPRYAIYLVIIFLILVFTCIIDLRCIPYACLIYFCVLYLTYKKNYIMKEKVIRHMDSLIFKLKTDDTILNFPIPAMIVDKIGNILWSNNEINILLKGINKQGYIENLIKELNEEYDKKFIGIDKEISIHDKHYRLLGNLVNLKKRGHDKDSVLMLYFIDRTEYYRLFKLYEDSKDCIGVITVDNYDELVQGMIDTDKPQLFATIERKLREWFAFTGGIMTSLDRNKYLIIFEKKFIKAFSETKFEILNEIKEVTLSNKIPVTLSIGIVYDEGNKNEKFQMALATMDMALGRGGDQAIIRRDGKHEFFGGNTKEVEKTTKVKPRVIAQALKELIDGSENVLIMGHKNMDADCLGAAMGAYRIATSFDKRTKILFNDFGVTIEGLYKKIAKEEQYENIFIKTADVVDYMKDDTLVIVVDTHMYDYVESPEVLAKANKIVIIDHHRRSTEYIENPVLTFHEVYASSTSELVTELLQYTEKNIALTKIEAECLYAGILTDTKNFTQKTGVRTFEAAAYLKKMGIDVAAINKSFQNDVDTYVAIADVIRNCEILFDTIAIAICPTGIENQIQITAQAADELLNLNGIETSFVLSNIDNKIYISGRSNGALNVQVILEKFGGGGHMMMAGAQLEEVTIDEAKKMLIEEIENNRKK